MIRKSLGFPSIRTEETEDPASAFQIFLLALTLLSIVNFVILVLPSQEDANEIILLVEAGISLFFFFDFVNRFLRADNKFRYLLNERGFLDLLSCMPFPLARIARLPRAWSTIRQLQDAGTKSTLRSLNSERSNVSIAAAAFLTILVVEFGSIAVMRPEIDSPDSNFQNASDVVWWAWVTITTVGYGDYYPVTDNGRIAGAVMMTLGLGLFAVVTGYIANIFLSPSSERREQRQQVERLQQDIRELHQKALEIDAKLESLLGNKGSSPDSRHTSDSEDLSVATGGRQRTISDRPDEHD